MDNSQTQNKSCIYQYLRVTYFCLLSAQNCDLEEVMMTKNGFYFAVAYMDVPNFQVGRTLQDATLSARLSILSMCVCVCVCDMVCVCVCVCVCLSLLNSSIT